MIVLSLGVMLLVPLPKEELHVVALYESYVRANGQKVSVKPLVVVDRPGKDVTLFLSAYEPATWQIVVGPRTNLTKVIVGGYHKQAAEVPKGVEVVEMFYESKARPTKEYISVNYKIDSAGFRSSIQSIRKLTGQEVWSFQGSYNYDPLTPITVSAVKLDERLSSEYPRVSLASEIPKVKFQTTFLTPTDLFSHAASYGDFTEAGPDKKSLNPLPKSIISAAYDPVGKKHYGLANQEIHAVDLSKATSEKMNPGPGLPEFSWPCGITFDTKRERLVVATLGGVGHLYTYTPKTGMWAAPADLNNIDLSALAYHPKDDTLYGIAGEAGGEGGGRPTLYRYNAQGALIKQSTLGAPMFPGVLGRGPVGIRVQMASAGDHLAVLVIGGWRNENGNPGKAESYLFLIDPVTDKVKLAWKE